MGESQRVKFYYTCCGLVEDGGVQKVAVKYYPCLTSFCVKPVVRFTWVTVGQDQLVTSFSRRSKTFDLLTIVMLRAAMVIIETLQVLIHKEHIRKYAFLLRAVQCNVQSCTEIRSERETQVQFRNTSGQQVGSKRQTSLGNVPSITSACQAKDRY